MQRRVVTYVASISALAVLFAGALVAAGYDLGNPWAVLGLALAAAVAERSTVTLTNTAQASPAVLPTLFAAVVLGPLVAAAVFSASMLGDPELFRRDPDSKSQFQFLKWANYTSVRFIVGGTMGLSAAAVMGAVSNEVGAIVAATLAASLVAELLEVAFSAGTARVRGIAARDIVRTILPIAITSVAVYAPIAAVLTLAYSQVSPWTAPLFLIPAIAANRLFGLFREQRRLIDGLATANETLERANLAFAGALVATLDARDPYTAGHSAAVAIYSRDIAERMGLPIEVQEQAYLSGLVHDIGKIGLPPGVLEKPGALTLDERRVMQEHSVIGERILAQVGDDYEEVALIVRHHHERMDGGGYPDGITGTEIPLLSRIIAVADAYNAMTSNRPYRDAMPSRVARLRLAQAVESQFDTACVAAFEAILAGEDESYRTAQRPDFFNFAQANAERLIEEILGTPEPMVDVA
jgi:HD-GYP domain-containing protein (c-di-GMP phosphodiesterase class II)